MRRSNARLAAAVPESSRTMSALKPNQLRVPSASSRVSFLSSSHPKPHRRSGGRRSRCVLLVAFVLAAALLCFFISSRRLNPPKFSIVVDGGSTGSRIHVFAYRTGWGAMPTLDVGLTASMKVTPGLSSYSSDPDSAGQSLVELLEFGKRRVPWDLWADTEVRLMATAGLRLLDVALVNRILESCRKILRSSGFRFQDDWASVIPGSDEGIYAWISANYALGTLGSDPQKTTGIFELGGASAQVTFVPSEPLGHEFSHLLKFGRITYNLYSRSFLSLGQNVAYNSLHDLLSSVDHKSSEDFIHEATYVDPCTPRGYVHSVGSIKLSTGLHDSKTKFGSFRAIGNFSECRLAALKLLQKEKDKCFHPHCHLGLTSMPKLQGRFYATENFFHTSKFFGLRETPSLSDLILAGERYCGEDWLKLRKKYATHDEEDLLRFCFSSAYIVALLHDTLGIVLGDGKVSFANQIGDVPLDWALGAFIMQLASRPGVDSPDWVTFIFDYEPWTWFPFSVLFILLISTAWSLYRWMKPKLKIIYDLEKGRYILTPGRQ